MLFNNNKDKSQTAIEWLVAKVAKLNQPFRNIWYFKTFYIKPAIRWCKLSKVFLKFWKIPFAIEDLQQASNYASKQIRIDAKHINNLNYNIKGLIDDVAAIREHYQPRPSGLTEEEHHKECMRYAFKGNCENYDHNDDKSLARATIGDVRLADEYLTAQEEDARFDLDYEEHRDGMAGCEVTYYDEFKFLLGSLNRRGFYDN